MAEAASTLLNLTTRLEVYGHTRLVKKTENRTRSVLPIKIGMPLVVGRAWKARPTRPHLDGELLGRPRDLMADSIGANIEVTVQCISLHRYIVILEIAQFRRLFVFGTDTCQIRGGFIGAFSNLVVLCQYGKALENILYTILYR